MASKLARKEVVEIEREGRKVKRKPLTNEDSTPERNVKARDIFQAIGPQAIGLLVGGLIGGRDGAIQGGQQGAATGAVLNSALNAQQQRADQRHDAEFAQSLALDAARSKEEQAAILNAIKQQNANNKTTELGQVKASNEFFDKQTKQPIIDTKRGFFVDLQGNRVDPNNVGSFKALSDEDRDANRALSERRANQTDIRISQSDRAFEEARRNRDELTDKQASEIIDLESGLKSLERVRELFQNVDTGPVAAAFQSAKAAVGLASDDFVKLRTETGNTLAKFVKSISGSAVSEEEAQRLAKLIPTEKDPERTFQSKLKQFEEILKESLNTKTKSLQRFQGKTIPIDQDADIDSILNF